MRFLWVVFLLCIGVVSPLFAACRVHPGAFETCDGNTTITTGGTAQNLFGGLLPKTGFSIANPDPTEDCWFSQSATAAPNGTGSQRLQANGGWYETPPGMRPMGPVSIVCATTGHKITAERW